jgi:hypothetical protein
MNIKKSTIHLRDFGYSTKLPSRYRIRAIKKACKKFSEETVVEHMIHLSKYHKQIKEDLKHIPFYVEQELIVRELREIEAAYSLVKAFDEQREQDILAPFQCPLTPVPRCQSRTGTDSTIEDEVYQIESVPLEELPIMIDI